MAWTYIRLYYSAFFAAHSILRCFGEAPVFLEVGHVNAIAKNATRYGYQLATGPSRGFYRLSVSEDAKFAKLSKLHDSHKDTWKCFIELLDRISDETANKAVALDATKREFISVLTSLRDALTDGGKFGRGEFLVEFRHRVNYRHEYGAWYPYKDSAVRFNDVSTSYMRWRNDDLEIKNRSAKSDVAIFVETCAAIVSFCRQISIGMADAASDAKSFQKLGPVRYLDELHGTT